MRAVEVTGTIDQKGQLSLDEYIEVEMPRRVKVIVLFTDEQEYDPDDTPIQELTLPTHRMRGILLALG